MFEFRPLHVTHFLSCAASGGAEVYIKDLAIAAVKKGHCVSIIFLDRAEEVGRDEAYQREFLDQLDKSGVKYDFVGAKARRNPLFGWLRTRKLLRQMASEIVHAHLFYGVFFSAKCGLPIIYTRHGIGLRLPKAIYRLVLNQIVSSYVGISVVCAQVLRDGGCRPVVQINNGVDASRVRARNLATTGASEVIRLSPTPFTFLAVGRLTGVKNYPRLLGAVAMLPKDRPWRLQIAGEGGARGDLEVLAVRLGVSDRVEFLGNVSDVNERLASSSVFVMSSDSEGLPIALIEATLAGLPVVVTNVGGCAEVVHAACNGIVVDEPGEECLSQALLRMLDDGELRSFFSRNALLYGSKYELSFALNEHLRLYADTVFGAQRPEAQCS